ncbi:4'-phosphopantetheinyl transferase AcpT [Kluyvera georgiana]|uniref:4'-phosphopantetheinyl transferase AcpT n=1 Tax=Kluyvera georgiana TaxID=73098 RepID=UPI000806F710|nr:4'-phosphopantetheinyl transferase AcpT [Kluyvera georgiana]
MYRLYLGNIPALSAIPLADHIMAAAPQGARRAAWLAGRALLSHVCSPLPEIIYGEQGKPAFAREQALWFNLSHSGDNIALLLSDEGEVGCDIEVIRPRPRWPSLVSAFYSAGEQAEIAAERPTHQLAAFWRIWTQKEAIVKQRGGGVWQMADIDSTQPTTRFIAHCQQNALSLAVCTPTPLNIQDIIVNFDPQL